MIYLCTSIRLGKSQMLANKAVALIMSSHDYVFLTEEHSVIFSQTKRQKNHDVIDTETYEKVQKLTPQGYFDVKMAVSDVIEKLLKTMKPCDVYRKLKGKCNMGSNELNRLIFKLSRA
jgi:predicted transcriptional regulator YheO